MSKTVRRLLLALFILLALLFLAGMLYARFWLDPMLKDQLVQTTANSSNQMYALHLDRIHVNIFTGSAEANGIYLSTDTLRWETMRQEKPDSTPLKINLQIQRLRIKGVGLIHFWRTRKLDLDGIQIVDPALELTTIKDTAGVKTPPTDTVSQDLFERLPQLIAPYAKSLNIGYIAVSNGKFSIQTLGQNHSAYQQADSINGVLSKVNIVTNDSVVNGRALYSGNILFTIRNLELYPAGNVYGYRIKSATLDGKAELLKLEGISIAPTISDAAFMQRLTLRVPRLKIWMEQILIRKLDLFRALHQQELNMESVIVETARVSLYQNKNLPLSRHKQMPHEMFRLIKPYLNIDTILVRNSNILYTELLDGDEGQLEFEQVHGVILNITNDSLKMSDASPARIDARAELMGAGLLDVSLQIPLLSPSFRCDYTAHLGRIDMTYINRLVAEKNNFRIDSGNAESMDLKVRVRNGLAQGTIAAAYENLEVSILRDKDKSKKKLVSAVANIVLRGANKRGQTDQPFKVGTIQYQREPTDGILRYIWRSAQMGLLETLVPRRISGGKMPD